MTHRPKGQCGLPYTADGALRPPLWGYPLPPPVGVPPMYYNFVRIHKTLRTTPAMAANVTKRLWEIGDIVDVLEAWENTT